jgi:hypothetical protein
MGAHLMIAMFVGLTGKVDDQPSRGGTVSQTCIRVQNGVERKMPRIEPRHDLSSLYHVGRPTQDFAMMRPALAGQHRQQGEHA